MHLHLLHPQHLEELVKNSSINLHLLHLNFQSLEGMSVYEYLLTSPHIPRTNSGMVKTGWLKSYRHITAGGWWCSGVDPLNNWQSMEWGCFKPNQPRCDQKGKLIKYEHPPGTPTRVFCLRVTLEIWQTVCHKYHLPVPTDITVNADGEAEGFWQWVITQNLPIIICEGAKKAAALLSLGYPALAVPGITSGYRVIKDKFGHVSNRQLIPDLAVFTTARRTFYICFDFETQPQKVAAVNNAIAQLGTLLQHKKCLVKVMQLPGNEKGVDEFITLKGAGSLEKVYCQSVDLEIYLAVSKPHAELTITPTLTLNTPYLGDISYPSSGLVAVKSAKGTGKTTALQSLINRAKDEQRPILLITHRIQLGKFLCKTIAISWGLAHQDSPTQSCGLCIDSIWKLHPQDWQGGIIILDEVEQCLWHLLNSNTCKDKRVKILKLFQQLVATVLSTGGLIIAQDADLSNVALEYLQGLAATKITPSVIVNQWQPSRGWDITFYDSPNPTPLIHQLELDLIAGRKCYVTTDSRSGRYSCETIESYLKERLARLKQEFPNSLVISSRTTSTPNHPAVDFVSSINEKITEYSTIFVTPSLGTGISIDVQHFDRVYGIFQGVIPDWEARQALARVRDDVPRVVWCAKRGIGLIGSGSTNYRLLSDWYQENQQENLALLSPLYSIDVDLPLVYDPIHLRTWAKLAARVNGSICLYRQSMADGLLAEGHQIWLRSSAVHNNIIRDLRLAFLATDAADLTNRKRLILEIVKVQKDWAHKRQKSKEIKQQIQDIKYQHQLMVAQGVANAQDIDYLTYENLLNKHSLTDKERYQIDKYRLKQRYGVPVTPALKLRDDKGYYLQLMIHYYLTHESTYFHMRDEQEWRQHLSSGEGQVFLPDLKTYTAKVEAMRALGMLGFLNIERQFTENDADLIWLTNVVRQHSKHIKRVLGIDLIKSNGNTSAINILRKLLSLVGLKLCRVNIGYQIDMATWLDGRAEIFQVWQQRDELLLMTMKSLKAQAKLGNPASFRLSLVREVMV